jgi:hypothetical protein
MKFGGNYFMIEIIFLTAMKIVIASKLAFREEATIVISGSIVSIEGC